MDIVYMGWHCLCTHSNTFHHVYYLLCCANTLKRQLIP